MNQHIRLSKSVIGDLEIEAVKRIMEIGYLGMGPEVGLFEDELKRFIGGNCSVTCVNTGTSALILALQACEIGFGDQVLVPTLTYVATFQAISAIGATPVAVDINPIHGGIDVKDARKKITQNTKAILPVHYASNFGDYELIYNLAKEFNLRVIEDACHAFGCKLNGKRCGSFGDIVCFSFDGIKNITSGEGGAVVSKDISIIKKIQDARLLGVESDTQKRLSGNRSWNFDVSDQGWRFHMSEIMAAIGRVQLSRFEEFAKARVKLAKSYQKAFKNIDGVTYFDFDYNNIVPHIFVLIIDYQKRDKVKSLLESKNIGVGIHYLPNHLLSFFKNSGGVLPNAETLYKKMLTLPLHPEISEKDQENIIKYVLEGLSLKD
tara:strand:+ start:2588 stop:3718 length:1131 start_codon:yes stop_codon:yes gene_type:complete